MAEDLPYEDGVFEHVLSALMLHHVEQDQRLLAWLASRSPRLRSNYDDGLLAAMHEAGFGEVTETGHRVSRFMGRVAFYRASV